MIEGQEILKSLDQRKIRIAFVAQPTDLLCPPVQGGSLAIWIYQVARICARRGHDTVVFANHGSLIRSGFTRSENVNYIYTPTGLNRLLNKAHKTIFSASRASGSIRADLPLFASAFQDLSYAMEVGRRSRRLKCDVVHIMNYSQLAPVIRMFNPDCKICLHMQCEWLTQLDFKVIERRLACVDFIIGVSDYITMKIARRFPQFKNRCVTVLNAAALAEESDRTKEQPDYVLFVGRVSPEKGVHVLVRAFHEVLKRYPQAQLHIVGGVGSAPLEYLVGLSNDPRVKDLCVFYENEGIGSKNSYIEILRKDAGKELGKRIFFDGRIEHDQIGSFYERTALLVNPSLSESFGMSLVEAMMHSVPVVATRVGGMTEIVDHGRTGLLVEPANPKALAEAICAILGDKEKVRRLGNAGRERAVEKFSWEKSTDALLKHFEAIVT
jgi:glycosyltransferase involved in cell wall biosynthesis